MADSVEVEFRDIPGFHGYQVSNTGLVRSKRWRKSPNSPDTWKVLKIKTEKDGRTTIKLIDGDRVQRCVGIATLVLEAFVGPRPSGMDACHFPDRDTSNNHLKNLRWDTRKANVQDAFTHGTFPLGERHCKAKLNVADVRKIRDLASQGWTRYQIAKLFPVDHSTVRDIINRKRWKSVL